MGMLCNSIATWAIGSVPNSGVLQDVIDSCREYFDNHSSDVSVQSVLQHTGPAHFTTRELKLVNESDVLGIEAFGCGQLHSNSPECSKADSRIWMKHRFEGK